MPKFHFDEEKAQLAVDFIQSLTLTEECLGQPFCLIEGHKKIVRDIYGYVDENGYRQYQQAFISFARKNAKTQLAAALAIKGLFADGEVSPKVYSAAVDKEQASLLFKMMKSMILANSTLSSLCKITDSQKMIQTSFNNGEFKALSSDGESKHGLNPTLVVFDELHGWKNQELWDALTTGSDTRKQPLFIYITTAGIDENSIWGRQYQYAKKIQLGSITNPRYYTSIWEVPSDADWKDEKNWYKANPGLGVTITVDKLRESFTQALDIPYEQTKFRRLKLNQVVRSNETWMDYDKWLASAGFVNPTELLGKTCYAGLDLSSTEDLTALVLTFPWDDGTFKILPFFFMPERSVQDHKRTDQVPYDTWVEQGLITATDGDVIDYDYVLEVIKKIASTYDLKEIAFDRYLSGSLGQTVTNLGIKMIPFGQGFVSMSGPTKQVINLVLQKKLHHGNNPVLNFMTSCATVTQDAAENIKLVKPNRRKSSNRIDGLIAMIMGFDRASRREEKKPSIYEQKGLTIL